MKLLSALIVTSIAFGSGAAAESVPFPKQRPGDSTVRPAGRGPVAINHSPQVMSLAPAPELQDLPFGDATPGPSACDIRLAEVASFSPRPGTVGPGECGAAEVVRLDSITLHDKSRVTLSPPPILRCSMAEALAHFVREDMAPASAELGAPLAAIVNYDSYECRGRNRVAGARLSEHGKGNAIDIRAVRLGNGGVFDLTSAIVAKDFRERVRAAACSRFNTVLGPGSDSYHESHIHLDLAQRQRGFKMCQWDVREPPVVANVPLPLPRPVSQAASEE